MKINSVFHLRRSGRFRGHNRRAEGRGNNSGSRHSIGVGLCHNMVWRDQRHQRSANAFDAGTRLHDRGRDGVSDVSLHDRPETIETGRSQCTSRRPTIVRTGGLDSDPIISKCLQSIDG